MAYIRTIPPEDAQGELRLLYDEVLRRRGAVANVYRAHSLRPDTLKPHLEFYLSVVYGPSGLSRLEREAIAVTVSMANGCEYCVRHHADALARYEKDPRVVQALVAGEVPPAATSRLRALLNYARAVASRPGQVTDQDVRALRSAGLSDEEILSANLTSSYFCFVNRFVLGLGIELEPLTAEYKY